MKQKKKQAGQSLVEVIYILGMVVILLTGLITAIIFSIKAARFSRHKANATRIARELIEEKKSQKQENSFWDSLGGYSESEWQCQETTESAPFRSRPCYRNYQSDAEEKSIDLQARVWWDSLEEPESEKKNMVIIETTLSNWEQ